MRPRLRSIAALATLLAALAGAAVWLSLPSGPAPGPAYVTVEDVERQEAIRLDSLLKPCGETWLPSSRQVPARDVMQAVQPNTPILEVIVLPSFDPPKVVQLYLHDGVWRAGVIHIDNEYWMNWRRPPPDPNKPPNDIALPAPAPAARLQEFPLSENAAARLVWELRRSVAAANPERGYGHDGVYYGIFIDGVCAEMWSPRPGSRNAQLQDLIEGVMAGQDDRALQRLFDALRPPLKTLPPAPAMLRRD